ncbi:MAG: arginine--tRNA ligase [Actinomycetota bacterium]
MTPAELSLAIRRALVNAVADGEISAPVPDEVLVERPRHRDHGDWSTNIAMVLAATAKAPPRQLAELLSYRLADIPGISSVAVAGPGFLNIVLDVAAAGELARTIVEAGPDYGDSAVHAGRVMNVEFVSANPTGPLHIGHTRWAALGDSLCRLLTATGAMVTAEHYVNDAGAQMDRFGASIVARALGQEVPEDGYHGEYINDLARGVLAEDATVTDVPPGQAMVTARDIGYRLVLTEMKHTLAEFGVHFDIWFSERELHDDGAVERAVQRLREQGHVYDQDNAVWLRTTDFGDDRDRVLVRSDGTPTYFAADAAYYLSKKDRGFPEKIYLLGADHHGYVSRLQAISACAGDDPAQAIEILIGQLVTVNGARLSKRAGMIVELRDLIEWIGADAVRYSLARYPADSPLNLDGEQLRRRSNDNPVYYVQYAHARTCNVARLAAADGVRRDAGFTPALLTDPTETELIALLGQFPSVVVQAATLREPHRVARYLEALSAGYHKWYDTCRVRPQSVDELITDLHRTRLWLNDAAGVVLARGLDLLGVSAPERM